MSPAVVGGSGGCRTVFIHGVLSAFEAVGLSNPIGVAYWALDIKERQLLLAAVELAEQGYDEVIAVAADPPDPLYQDIFGSRVVPTGVGGAKIHILMPDHDPGPQGADFTEATDEGLVTVYQQGYERGQRFLMEAAP